MPQNSLSFDYFKMLKFIVPILACMGAFIHCERPQHVLDTAVTSTHAGSLAVFYALWLCSVVLWSVYTFLGKVCYRAFISICKRNCVGTLVIAHVLKGVLVWSYVCIALVTIIQCINEWKGMNFCFDGPFAAMLFLLGVSSATVIVLEKVIDFCSEIIYFTYRDTQHNNGTGFVVDCHLCCFLLLLVLFVAAAVLKLCLIYGFDFSLNICDVLATLREIVCVKTVLCLYLMPKKAPVRARFDCLC